MKKSLSILSIAALALLITSCNQSQDSTSETTQQPQATQTPQPNASPSPKVAASETEQPASPQKTTPQNPESVVGLIPSTNPTERRQQIAQGRKDPFGFVPIQPTLKTIPTPPQSQTPPTTGSPQPSATNPPTTNSPQPSAANPPSRSSRTPSGTQSQPQPVLPPQPELAQGVAISGIIDIGGTPQIIVKAPGERSSRYVQVGDRLSNGQVLIKRIENYRSPAPVVVLEELGQEVFKEVGEGVAAEEPAETKPAQDDTTALMIPDLRSGEL
jgi:hypothetical protein